EYLEKLIKEGRLKFTKEFKKKVFYHDPCHLGRHLKIYDEPRKVLSMIPDAKIVEFAEARDMARCCGGGGGVRAADPAAAQRIASRRVVAASQIADLIVTACPFCVTNLRYGNEIVKVDIGIKDIAELIDDLLIA
ncbi:MAG: (Fe-S)-binding protein, partial [Thermoplasmata archaeon]